MYVCLGDLECLFGDVRSNGLCSWVFWWATGVPFLKTGKWMVCGNRDTVFPIGCWLPRAGYLCRKRKHIDTLFFLCGGLYLDVFVCVHVHPSLTQSLGKPFFQIGVSILGFRFLYVSVWPEQSAQFQISISLLACPSLPHRWNSPRVLFAQASESYVPLSALKFV